MNYVVDSYENYKEENRLTTNNARDVYKRQGRCCVYFRRAEYRTAPA